MLHEQNFFFFLFWSLEQNACGIHMCHGKCLNSNAAADPAAAMVHWRCLASLCRALLYIHTCTSFHVTKLSDKTGQHQLSTTHSHPYASPTASHQARHQNPRLQKAKLSVSREAVPSAAPDFLLILIFCLRAIPAGTCRASSGTPDGR